MTAEVQAHLVRGRLARNTIKGEDRRSDERQALGSDKRVNMFTPESQTGVIVINSSGAAEAMKEKSLVGFQD
jgi:hypothetical protein